MLAFVVLVLTFCWTWNVAALYTGSVRESERPRTWVQTIFYLTVAVILTALSIYREQ